jgi:hypothetical protein
MSVHDIRVSTFMFRCLKDGTWCECVAPKTGEDFKIGDVACCREFDEVALRYGSSPPLVFRITRVATHFSDLSRIPRGFYLVGFEPIEPIANPPVVEYQRVAKDNRLPATPRAPTRWPF